MSLTVIVNDRRSTRQVTSRQLTTLNRDIAAYMTKVRFRDCRERRRMSGHGALCGRKLFHFVSEDLWRNVGKNVG